MNVLKGAVSEKITPTKAKALLVRNTSNRKLNDRLVTEYARLMGENLWELNGETIKVAEDGTLIDGQHRLEACVKANVPFETYVVYSLDKSTFDTVDVGRKRTHGDMLSVNGVMNSAATAAACRWIHSYKTLKTHPNNQKLSAHEVIEVYESDPEGISHAVTRATTTCKNLIPSGPASMLYYFAAKKSATQVDYFFDAMQTGAGLHNGDPILTFRNKIIKHKTLGKNRILDLEMAAMLIHTWNAYRAGQKLSVITGTKVHGDKTPTMPTIK